MLDALYRVRDEHDEEDAEEDALVGHLDPLLNRGYHEMGPGTAIREAVWVTNRGF